MKLTLLWHGTRNTDLEICGIPGNSGSSWLSNVEIRFNGPFCKYFKVAQYIWMLCLKFSTLLKGKGILNFFTNDKLGIFDVGIAFH